MVSFRKILLTTSRNPTSRIRTFCNDLAQVIPNLVRVNRGKMSMNGVAEKALEHDANLVVVLDRWHGGLGAIKFFQVDESGLVSIPPIVHVAGMRLRREFGVSKVKPARSIVLLAPETSSEVSRLADTFSKFFGIPILPMEEVVKTGSTLMGIKRDEGNRIVVTFMAEPNHVEVGPRIIVLSVEW